MGESREDRHQRLSAALAAYTDTELAGLVDAAPAGPVGIGGGSATLDLGGVPVFVKRLPLTDRERAHPRSTANLFDLPTVCQYGIGGPGFGAWRELVANEMVTAQDGGTGPVPLLHHWRVLPGRAPIAEEHADIEQVVTRYGGSQPVRERMLAVAAATTSLVLFCEHVPYPLIDWFQADPAGRAVTLDRQLRDISAFLRRAEVLHFDGHIGNLRTDGERIHLTDFGLATSPRFELSADERRFVELNPTHDEDFAATVVVNWLTVTVCGIPLPDSGGPVERNAFVRRCADGDVPDDLPPDVAAILHRHAPTAVRVNDLYWALFAAHG